MAIVKVVEILAQSEKGWEDAAQVAISKAGESVHNITSVYIKEMEATVENNKISQYRVNAKVCFKVD